MVQDTGRRQRNRLERHGAFLAAAKQVVFSDGLEQLTMQRLAEAVDCAVGTAYTYFPSKSALVAEVQREAIEVLDESCARFEVVFHQEIGRRERDPAIRSLALVIGYARFWVDTFDTFPEEARLLQLLMSETSHSVDDQDVGRVVPAALRILERTKAALDHAAEIGAVTAGAAMERTVVLAAALNGVLLLEHVARVDPDLFDGRRLAGSLVADLLKGWGADGASVAAATRRIDRLARRGPLATRPETRVPVSARKEERT